MRSCSVPTLFLALSLATATWLCADADRVAAQESDGDAAGPKPVQVVDDLPAVDEWPMFRGCPSLKGVARGSLPDRLVVRWTFLTEGAVTSSPAISGGRVYFGSDDGKVYCLTLEGDKLWEFQTEDIIEAPPLVLDGMVYIGSSDYFFYALDAASGDLEWKYETNDKILGGANWVRGADGRLYVLVGSYDASLYCFEAKKGDRTWFYTTDNYVNGTPARLGDKIVFGGCDAILHVVSATRGEALDKIELGSDCHIAGSAALVGDLAYFGHYGNQFVCADLKKHEPVWGYNSQRHPFFSSPSVTPERVVFGGRDKSLHCAKTSDGTKLWTFPTRRKVDGSPVICGDKVVFGGGDGRLYLLSLETGEELWSYEIGQALVASPAVASGLVIIGSNDKHVYAFGAAEASGAGKGNGE